VQRLEKEFSGDYSILRVIFSNKDPLLAYHMLKTKIPTDTFEEYLEYLDAKETLEEWGRNSAKAEAERQAQQNNRKR